MYEIIKELSSKTSLARQQGTGQLCVVKQIGAEDLPLYKKFAEVKSEYVAKFYETAVIDGEISAVFEYVEGVTLKDYIAKNGNLSESRALKFASEICEGLKAIHALGIVHRDINPQNIIITPSGEIKIIDFDIIRTEKAGKAADTQLLGTPGYAAPEQFGFSQTSAKTDIYALGAVINYMLTGCTPGEKLAKGRFKKVILKCTMVDENNRYQTAAEAERAINRRPAIEVPGFRKGRLSHKIIASVYYALALALTVVMVLPSETAGELLLWLMACVFVLWVPVPLLCNYKNYLGRFKLLRSSSKAAKTAFSIFLSVVSVAIGFVFLVLVIYRYYS